MNRRPPTDFPFDQVYESLARPLVDKKLEENPMRPLLLGVLVDGERVVSVRDFPAAHFFDSLATKEALGVVIRNLLPCIGANMCLALLAESWVKSTTPDGAARIDRSRSLEFDPAATEAVVITLYGPDGATRVGALPIFPDRVVKYRPLRDADGVASGRLTPNPDIDATMATAVADAAVRKAQRTS